MRVKLNVIFIIFFFLFTLLSYGQVITTYAGTGVYGYTGDGGMKDTCKMAGPSDICLDGSGNLYVAEYYNSLVRKVSNTGIVFTIAGTGMWGNSGDGGVATSATFGELHDIAIDFKGNIYTCDAFHNRVRKINTQALSPILPGLAFLIFQVTVVLRPLLNLVIQWLWLSIKLEMFIFLITVMEE